MWTRKTLASAEEPLGIGERLRNAREARGYSLAAMERLTKVRSTYLQALEDEQFDRLPERIYTRGFLRTYATALGFNAAELLEVYDRAFAEQVVPIVGDRAIEIPIRPATPRSRLRRILIYATTVLGLVLIFLAYVGVQQIREFSQPTPPAPVGGVGPPTKAPVPSPQPSPRPTAPAPAPSVPAPSAVLPQPAVQPGEVRLEVKATGRSWLRVVGDGVLLYEGFIASGEVLSWTVHKQFTVRVGYLPSVAFLLNGQAVTPKSADPVWEGTFAAGQ